MSRQINESCTASKYIQEEHIKHTTKSKTYKLDILYNEDSVHHWKIVISISNFGPDHLCPSIGLLSMPSHHSTDKYVRRNISLMVQLKYI
uniref:Uncharacterized protein n=1 Tax=Rhizophora mucronata TaxID=61149 RepID=A0A2P2IMK8_RHIMU